MASHRSTCKTLLGAICLYHFSQIIFAEDLLEKCRKDKTFRHAENSDIGVTCGSERVSLSILLCPIYFNGFNESLMSLNGLHSKPSCKGIADWTIIPPVLNFSISITEKAINECKSSLTITQEPGTGDFAHFSMVQKINVSGSICSHDPTNRDITYFPDVMYMFSCSYPLQYLIHNTRMNVSSVSLAVKDTNGSFISTLRMELYGSHRHGLRMPIDLKTRIWVQVSASNLTAKFHVLLDRCYTTSTPFSSSTYYDLFVGCNHDPQTVMEVNGEEQVARFSFEAFRFLESTNLPVSTYYVHCVTRLCLDTVCGSLIQDCSARGKRSVNEPDTSVTDRATVTSGPITINIDNGYLLTGNGFGDETDKTVVAVSVIAGIIGVICLTLVAFIVYNKYYTKIMPELGKTIIYPQD